MKKLTIRCGISGSGKSTWAHTEWKKDPLNTTIVNRDKITRLEVIDEQGRVYTNNNCRLEIQQQDEGRTLKVFVTKRTEEQEKTKTDVSKLMESIGIFKDK